MISYHLEPADPEGTWKYGKNFRVGDTHDFARISRAVCHLVWSGIVWRDGVRRQNNFLSSDWCVLDFDSGEMTLAQALRNFADAAHIIGTTKSHQKAKKDQPACDRFRVLVPWETRIEDLEAYRYNMKSIVDNYPVDPACKDGARYFFPCQEIVSVESEGFKADVFPPPPGTSARLSRASERPTRVSQYALRMLKQEIHPGTRNITFWRVAKDLLRAGLDAEVIEALINDSPTQRKYPLPATEVQALVRSAAKALEEDARG